MDEGGAPTVSVFFVHGFEAFGASSKRPDDGILPWAGRVVHFRTDLLALIAWQANYRVFVQTFTSRAPEHVETIAKELAEKAKLAHDQGHMVKLVGYSTGGIICVLAAGSLKHEYHIDVQQVIAVDTPFDGISGRVLCLARAYASSVVDKIRSSVDKTRKKFRKLPWELKFAASLGVVGTAVLTVALAGELERSTKAFSWFGAITLRNTLDLMPMAIFGLSVAAGGFCGIGATITALGDKLVVFRPTDMSLFPVPGGCEINNVILIPGGPEKVTDIGSLMERCRLHIDIPKRLDVALALFWLVLE